MTVPHLMNCPHSDEGWCLDCVVTMGNENWELRDALAAVLALPVAEKEMSYLRRGIGTATPNAAWLQAERLLVRPNARLKGARDGADEAT